MKFMWLFCACFWMRSQSRVEAKEQSTASLLRRRHRRRSPCCLEQDPSLIWNSPSRLGWQPRKPERPSCIPLFCIGLLAGTTLLSSFLSSLPALPPFLSFCSECEFRGARPMLTRQALHCPISQAHKKIISQTHKKMYWFAKDYVLNLCLHVHVCLLVCACACGCPWRLADTGSPGSQEVVSHPIWVQGNKLRSGPLQEY